MKLKSCLMILSLFALTAQAGSRSLVQILTEVKDLKAKNDTNSIYRIIGGHSNAPAEELPFLTAEVHTLRKDRRGFSATASFRIEPQGQNKRLYLTMRNSYPASKSELRAQWSESEMRIISDLVNNGILPSKKYVERAFVNNKLQESSVRFFDVSLLSEKKLQKLIEIMKGPNASQGAF